jgi:Uma2 family endonuclease
MGSAATRRTLTPEDFLAWEADQLEKHEFYFGEVFGMAGGTPDHARIILNTAFVLESALRGSGCRAFSSDLAVELDAAGHFAYPDVTVICGEVQLRPDSHVVQNPTLIVEVLSPSTERWDQGGKLRSYRALPSVQAVLLVASAHRSAELYQRDRDSWRLVDPDAEGRLTIEAVGATLSMADLYDGVEVPDRPAWPSPEETERRG